MVGFSKQSGGLHQSEKIRSVKLLTRYHRVTPKLNVKGLLLFVEKYTNKKWVCRSFFTDKFIKRSKSLTHSIIEKEVKTLKKYLWPKQSMYETFLKECQTPNKK